MTAAKTHRPRRSRATRLDPYAIEETTLTLEQWRRLQEPTDAEVRRHAKARSGRSGR